jgi:hypothetical protein
LFRYYAVFTYAVAVDVDNDATFFGLLSNNISVNTKSSTVEVDTKYVNFVNVTVFITDCSVKA